MGVKELNPDQVIPHDLSLDESRVLDVLFSEPRVQLDAPQIAARATMTLDDMERALGSLLRRGFVCWVNGGGRARYTLV